MHCSAEMRMSEQCTFTKTQVIRGLWKEVLMNLTHNDEDKIKLIKGRRKCMPAGRQEDAEQTKVNDDFKQR